MLEAIWAADGPHGELRQLPRGGRATARSRASMVAFRAEDGDALARRFLAARVLRLPAWQLAARPAPPARVGRGHARAARADAVRRRAGRRRRAHRRAGVATRAARPTPSARPRQRGLRGVSLDTGLQNTGAQALYEAYGFTRGGERRAPTTRSPRAVGGPGFVSYFKPL